MDARDLCRGGVVHTGLQLADPLMKQRGGIQFGGSKIVVAQNRLGTGANVHLKNVIQRRGWVDGADFDGGLPLLARSESKRSRYGRLAHAAFAEDEGEGHIERGPRNLSKAN